MKGQEKLSKALLKRLDELPKSILLVGPKGCGKHSIVNVLAAMNVIDVVDITESLNLESITDIMLSPHKRIYTIDTSKITEKEQNVILKFLEEPPANATIVLLAESTASLLDTIVNRCIKYAFEAYDKETLCSFIDDDSTKESLLSICETPGQIIDMHSKNINELRDICSKAITSMHKASYQNALSLSDKINFKDEYDKFEMWMFFKMIKDVAVKMSIECGSDMRHCIDVYNTTREYERMAVDSRLNKSQLFDNYITRLWKDARGERR